MSLTNDVTDILSTVNKRRDILALVERGIHDRREIARRADLSKTTVYRSLNQLEEAGLVTDTGDGYLTTDFGAWLFDEFDSLFERSSLALEHRELLYHLPMEFDPGQFEDGETVHSREYDPQAPYRALERYVEASSSITAITPTLQRTVLDSLSTSLDSGQLEVELFTDDEAVSAVPSEYDEVLSHEDTETNVVESPPEIGLYRMDDGTSLTTFSENYHVTTVHTTDAEAVVTAVDELIDEYRTEARPLIAEV